MRPEGGSVLASDVAGRAELLDALAARRADLVAVVDDLTPAQRVAPAPGGWTPLGLVARLADAERFFFQQLVAGRAQPRGDADPAPTCRDAVVGRYRYQCARSDALLALTSLDAPLTRPVPPSLALAHVRDVRAVVRHMVEETARHADLLRLARELLAGPPLRRT